MLSPTGQPAGKPHISSHTGIRYQALHLPGPFDFVYEPMYHSTNYYLLTTDSHKFFYAHSLSSSQRLVFRSIASIISAMRRA
jgi:hypothetical protein